MDVKNQTWLKTTIVMSCFFLAFYPVVTSESETHIFGEEKMQHYRGRAKQMFYHAYDSYMMYAYPFDELRPLTCDGHNTWGSYSLSLIDALDTLVVLGNHTEFQRASALLLEGLDFNKDINVSVFETNIRVVGGLLSAHLFSKRGGLRLEPGWPCRGPLLRLALQVADRLLPAFATPTGMPYGTVNLMHGVPPGETPITCTAGVGTYLVEFGTLSRLTGNTTYEEVAQKAADALWERRSAIGLLGNHINVLTGDWTALDAGIGAGVDSYFEYLLKAGVLLHRPTLIRQLHEIIRDVELHLKKEDWYVWAHMKTGAVTLPVFQSLEAFWPGLQSLMGESEKGRRTIMNYFSVWQQHGTTPEFYSLTKNAPYKDREGYPLRPELVESAMYLYQATKDPFMLHIGATVIESIDAIAKTRCGYAVVHNVSNHRLANRMESFFLAETTKYLYLLFDEDNFIHNSGSSGTVMQTPRGKCVLDAGGYIFNTEAHPMDIAALDCCHSPPRQQIIDAVNDIDLLKVIDLTRPTMSRLRKVEPDHDTYTAPKDNSEADNNYEITDSGKEDLLTCRIESFYNILAINSEITNI